MAKEVIHRKASDNVYLHKDFHGALSAAVDYLDRNYGEQAVRDYLRQFAVAFCSPLKKALRQRGLVAIKEHFENIYAIEGGKIRIEFSPDEMILRVEACPAVTHMRQKGYPVARLFHETTATVCQAICEGTGFAFEQVEYEPETGRSVQRFHRRRQ